MKQVVKWTAEGAVKWIYHSSGYPEYSATCGHTSFARDMLVSCQAHELYREFKVAPRIVKIYSSLTELKFCQGRFFSEQKSTVEQVDLHARMQGHMRTLDSTT